MSSKGLLSRSLVLLVTLVVVLVTPLVQDVSSQQLPPIPSYPDVAVALPSVNAGPTAPMVVQPGGCALLVLRDEYSSNTITGGYAWRVDYVDGRALVLNYTVNVRRVSTTEVDLCVPGNAESGVYDLVLLGDTRLVLPRSLWIVSQIPRRLRVAVVSDTHFGVTGKTDLWRYSAAMIVNSLNPDIVIWTGDIQDVDTEYAARLAQVYRYIMYYKYPVFSVPGNHDRPGVYYSTYLGPRDWARVVSDSLLIVGVYTDPGLHVTSIMSWDQLVFLEEVLRNYSHVPVKIIAMHYPMFFCREPCVVQASYDDEEVLKPFAPGVRTPVSSYWSTNMTEFRYTLKLIEDYNVTAVLAGHIHRDQYILYISTRTGSTTHFITVTSSGQTTPTYPGVRVFEIDLDTREVVLIEHPLVGIFSIPVEYQDVGVDTVVVRGGEAYKVSVRNKLFWLNISFSTIMPIPWAHAGPDPSIRVLEVSGHSDIEVKHIIRYGTYAYLHVELSIPSRGIVSFVVHRVEDKKPPSIRVLEWMPKTPTLNRSFTIYFEYVDDEWGVDPDSIQVDSNCTVRISARLIPGTYITVFNKVALELRFTVTATNTTACTLTLRGRDIAGSSSEKAYLVVFYPAGVTPREQPVRELLELTGEEQQVEPKPEETTPITEEPRPPVETQQPTVETPTSPVYESPQPSTPHYEPEAEVLDSLIIATVGVIVAVAIVLFIAKTWITGRRKL